VGDQDAGQESIEVFKSFGVFVSKKVNRPTLKKPKLGNFGRPPQGAKIFFQDFEYTTFDRTLRSTSGVKMKEIEDVYFFALYGSVLFSRDMCFKSLRA
jgi:hypothetical protein